MVFCLTSRDLVRQIATQARSDVWDFQPKRWTRFSGLPQGCAQKRKAVTTQAALFQ
jgi:hypothetical protein